MTRAEARAYFKEKGLTYGDISRTDLVYLLALFNLNFMKQRTERAKAGLRPYWLRAHVVQIGMETWGENGAMNSAYLAGKGEAFVSREVIHFHRNGEISFCPGVGDANAAPVLAAFVEWCDAMAEYKAMKKEDKYD